MCMYLLDRCHSGGRDKVLVLISLSVICRLVDAINRYTSDG